MKRLMRNIGLFFIAWCMAAAAAEKKSILDYYRLLGPDQLGGTKFELVKRGKTWKAVSPITEAELSCVVDIPNGYLEITDHGTGGGTITHTAALFVSKAGQRVVAVAIDTFDGIASEHLLLIFKEEKGRMIACPDMMPRVAPAEFFQTGYDPRPVMGRISVAYELPRHGTTVRARLDTSGLEAAKSGYAGEEAARLAAEALKRIAFRSVDIFWDAEKARFTVGNKRK